MPIIPKAVLAAMEKLGAKYQLIEHRRVFTALDKAATLHVDPKIVVKTAVFQAGKKYALVLVPSGKNIDKAKVKSVMNAALKRAGEKPEKTVDFATEKWMKNNLPGDIGATPIAPAAADCHILVDNALLKLSKMYLNAGSYTHSFLVNQSGFKKIIGKEFINGAFAKAKK